MSLIDSMPLKPGKSGALRRDPVFSESAGTSAQLQYQQGPLTGLSATPPLPVGLSWDPTEGLLSTRKQIALPRK